VEFAGELHDFLTTDVVRWFPDLKSEIQVMLIEASDHLLGPFDARLVSYVEALLKKRKFDVRTGVRVTAVHRNDVELSSGETVPCGLVVWSTGIQPVKLMQTLAEKDTLAWSRGRLLMDDYMRVLRSSPDGKSHEVVPDVYGLGDCAVSSTNPLPTLGGIARMQAAYLAKKFNSGKLDGSGKAYRNISLLQMSSVGSQDAIIDPTISPLGKRSPVINGFLGKILWASAYWGFQVSTANKILIPMYWFKSWLFGRDISRF